MMYVKYLDKKREYILHNLLNLLKVQTVRFKHFVNNVMLIIVHGVPWKHRYQL